MSIAPGPCDFPSSIDTTVDFPHLLFQEAFATHLKISATEAMRFASLIKKVLKHIPYDENFKHFSKETVQKSAGLGDRFRSVYLAHKDETNIGIVVCSPELICLHERINNAGLPGRRKIRGADYFCLKDGALTHTSTIVNISSGNYLDSWERGLKIHRYIWNNFARAIPLTVPHTCLGGYLSKSGKPKAALAQERYYGDLHNYVRHRKHRHLSLKDAANCGHDLSAALSRLHLEGFIHFDIRPDNIFISQTGSLLLGDLEKTVSRGLYMSLFSAPGYPYLPRQAEADGDCLDFTDTYGLAATLVELIVGDDSFQELHPENKDSLKLRWKDFFAGFIRRKFLEKLSNKAPEALVSDSYLTFIANFDSLRSGCSCSLAGLFQMILDYCAFLKKQLVDDGADQPLIRNVEKISNKMSAYEIFGKLIEDVLNMEELLYQEMVAKQRHFAFKREGKRIIFDTANSYTKALISETQNIDIIAAACNRIIAKI